ncbi:hypothetical protein OC846_001181 [Tilletia horrida]|uniref:Uncharacterized protein n=1 Tax=Tilletia horrida TaxID=155126 RepID=A0AAN6JTQ3_9BASI|nr:hypothetical protein OC846_001181 [Tilletia horrida]
MQAIWRMQWLRQQRINRQREFLEKLRRQRRISALQRLRQASSTSTDSASSIAEIDAASASQGTILKDVLKDFELATKHADVRLWVNEVEKMRLIQQQRKLLQEVQSLEAEVTRLSHQSAGAAGGGGPVRPAGSEHDVPALFQSYPSFFQNKVGLPLQIPGLTLRRLQAYV